MDSALLRNALYKIEYFNAMKKTAEENYRLQVEAENEKYDKKVGSLMKKREKTMKYVEKNLQKLNLQVAKFESIM